MYVLHLLAKLGVSVAFDILSVSTIFKRYAHSRDTSKASRGLGDSGSQDRQPITAYLNILQIVGFVAMECETADAYLRLIGLSQIGIDQLCADGNIEATIGMSYMLAERLVDTVPIR